MKVLSFNEIINKEDGQNHINVYSKGKTELGQLLSNFAHTPFTYKDRRFESVEGFWFFKRTEDKKFQFLYGSEAKKRGQEANLLYPRPNRDELKEVYKCKLKENPQVRELLLESTLPFAHYYVYANQPKIADEYLWTVELWEELRNEFKSMDKYEKLVGPEWARLFKHFFESKTFKKIGKTLKELQNSGTKVYPVFDDVFRAFRECPYNELTTVILTNNPYTKESDGLALSSKDKTPVLDNIFHAIEEDVARGLYLDRKTDLKRWANQGVLLLNIDLTTDGKKQIDHIELWELFIEEVMEKLADYNTGLIYVLMGKKAKRYIDFINPLSNDFYLVEHPMMSVVEKRPWRSKNIFSTINRIGKFINNKEIQWT